MDPGEAPFESAEELLVVVDQQLGVEPADDVELGDRLVDVAGRNLDSLLDRIGPSAVAVAPRNIEGAQLARGDTDVGRIEVTVDVVVGGIAVKPFAYQIGQSPDSEEIGGHRDEQAVVVVQSLAGKHLLGHRGESRVTQSEITCCGHHHAIIFATQSRFNRTDRSI